MGRVQSEVSNRAAVAGFATAGGCTPPSTQGVVAEPLTDESAVRIALERNPEVLEAFERLGVARARLVQAGLIPNPSLSFSAKFFSEGPEIELGLVQALLDVATSGSRRAEASADRSVVEAEVVAGIVGLVFDVRRALVDVRASERLVETHGKNFAAARASRELMETLHKAGNVRDDLRTTELLAESRAEIELSRAVAERRAARARLAGLLGLRRAESEWTVAGPLTDDVPTLAATLPVEDAAESTSLSLLAGRSRTAAAARRRGIAVVERGFLVREAGVVAKRESSDGSWGAGPEFRLEIPVFDSGAARQAIAEGEVRQMLAAYEGDRLHVRTAAVLLRDRATELRERATLLRERHLPQRKQLVREVIERYNAMQIGAFEVLLAKQQELDADREHVETLREAWLAYLDLQELLAGNADADVLPNHREPRPSGRSETKEDHR
jgi:cobalt-zinc-cadmium efflux system outer membrane protein